MRVIAPASGISRLDWLKNVEDDTRVDARCLADKTAEAAPTGDFEAEVGDFDPLKPAEDALSEFPSDEVLAISRPDDDASWLEAGSGEDYADPVPGPPCDVAVDGSLTES